MHVVRHRSTGQVLTSTTSGERAKQLCYGHEQYVATYDRGASQYYWYLGRLPLGQPHPYDAEAVAALETERDRLETGYLARPKG
jgi:hypothetical protein